MNSSSTHTLLLNDVMLKHTTITVWYRIKKGFNTKKKIMGGEFFVPILHCTASGLYCKLKESRQHYLK
jgi:hypothetical protein